MAVVGLGPPPVPRPSPRREGRQEPLLRLNGLRGVIKTDQSDVASFIVSSTYIPTTEDTEVQRPSKRLRAESLAKVEGYWTVIVGLEGGWFGFTLTQQALEDVVHQHVPSSEQHSITNGGMDAFAKQVEEAFRDGSMGFSAPKGEGVADWTRIFLYIGLEASHPIKMRLPRLDPTTALRCSTKLCLSSFSQTSTADATSSVAAKVEQGDLRVQISDLQRKLETTQKALRDERHKYRTMLNNGSQRRRGGVGVGGGGSQKVRIPSSSSSDSSWQLPSSSQSHINVGNSSSSSSRVITSSSARGRGGAGGVGEILSSDPPLPSSSDSGFEVEDMEIPRASQRNLSIVNPTRIHRARPGQDEGFVGDEDEDEE